MHRNPEKVSVSITLTTLLVLLNVIVLQKAYVAHQRWYSLLWVTIPLLVFVAVVYRKRG